MMSCLPKISEMNDLLLAPRSSRRRFALIDSVSRVNNQTQYRQSTFMISTNGLNKSRLNDLIIHGPPTPPGQGSCGFNKGRSIVVK